MKTIEVDDELYSYIASHTKHIGERIRHFTAYVEVFRHDTANCFGTERDACGATRRRSETGQSGKRQSSRDA